MPRNPYEILPESHWNAYRDPYEICPLKSSDLRAVRRDLLIPQGIEIANNMLSFMQISMKPQSLRKHLRNDTLTIPLELSQSAIARGFPFQGLAQVHIGIACKMNEIP